jgi:hydrogenase-4 component B
MSLASYFLVNFEHESEQVRQAGLLYLIMAHLGTAFLLAAFLLLFAATGQHLSFDAFRLGAGGMNAFTRNLVFLCALIGFGTKAGLMPLHFWLPRAHPVAPSHVSALMSGVMIKLAIYGLVRVSFDFLLSGGGPDGSHQVSHLLVVPPIWWGLLLLGVGLVSAVLGVLYAMVETDLKKLLAFSSIENMGIICLGLGAALLFRSFPIPFAQELVALSLFAAFFHLFNHTLFKGTLFLGAGAVLHATHTRNLDQLGGLLKRMPWTGLCFLIGALAISGLPPFNGFVSEWLTYQALLASVASAPDIWVKGFCTLALGGLALTGALAATTFVKAFGIGFLAQPRSEAAANAHEVSWTMRLGMVGGAVCIATAGIASPAVLTLLRPLVEQWAGVGSTHLLTTHLLWSLPAPGPHPSSAGGDLVLPVLLLPLVIAVLSWYLVRWFAGRTRRRIEETWACGVSLQPSMEYTATAFVKPLRRVFQLVLLPHRETRISYLVEPYIIERAEYRSVIASLFASEGARVLHRRFFSLVNLIKILQNGSLRLYLAYILVVMVLLLILAR